ncbi:MAG TPA: hypothetical protein VN452_02830 [Longilinea sp.]|nr:hypothetical protein [Longilinea sp.]
MFRLIFSLFFSAWFGLLLQNATGPRLDQPLPGQPLQGVVSIAGSTQLDGFASAQIEFRFEDNPAQTWFLIQENIPAIENDVLASWDTTTITDGTYRLRLSVKMTDGSTLTAEVAGVRVRNYSLIETITPAFFPEETIQASPSPSLAPVTAVITPTPQPPNPVTVTSINLRTSAGRGLLVVLGLFLLFGIYFGLSRLRRR